MHESRKMGGNFISCFLFLHFIMIMCSYGSRARETAELENHQTIPKEHTHAHHHFPTDKDVNQIFFTLKDLKVGKRMPFYFPIINPATSPKLWPREKSDSLPFSSNQLPYLLKHFSFSPNSPQAKAMEDTLRSCESKPIKGEVKFCATSYESMLEFTQSILGVTNTHHIQVFATSHKTKPSVAIQNYTFLENIVEIPAPKVVACHTMSYPYAVFYCHSLESESKVYKIPLAGDNGDKVESMALCHMDTSQWAASHISFQILGVKPGSPVCHVFPDDNLIWVPKLQSHDYSAL